MVQFSRATSQRRDQRDYELLDDEAVVDETNLARLQLHLCRISNEDPVRLDGAHAVRDVLRRRPAILELPAGRRRALQQRSKKRSATSSHIMLLLTVRMTCTPMVCHQPRDVNSKLQSGLTPSGRLGP